LKQYKSLNKVIQDLSTELTKILIHNKYLLDNEKDLSIVLECHLKSQMEDIYNLGKNSIITNDLSYLNLNLNKTFDN